MARIEPNYRSNYWARRAVRAVGGAVAGRVGRSVLNYGGTMAAAGEALYLLGKRYDFISAENRLRNLSICVAGAVAAGTVVLKALAPAILWAFGKLEGIEVPPSVRDISLTRKAFRKLSRDLGDLSQFRADLEKAATRNPALEAAAASLRTAIEARNYRQVRDVLTDNINPALITAHNNGLLGELTRESYGLSAKLYARALYLATLRSASEDICASLRNRDHAQAKATLDNVLTILDRQDLKGVVNFSGRVRALLSRATEAAWGLSRVAAPAVAAAPVTPSVPPPPPAPPAAPSVPPPSGPSLPPIMGGPRRP